MQPKATMHRELEKYDPTTDLHDRWPDWNVYLVNMDGGEIIDASSRSIWIDPHTADEEFALAHALSHIDLSHHLVPGREFSEAQCEDADWLARVRIEL